MTIQLFKSEKSKLRKFIRLFYSKKCTQIVYHLIMELSRIARIGYLIEYQYLKF